MQQKQVWALNEVLMIWIFSSIHTPAPTCLLQVACLHISKPKFLLTGMSYPIWLANSFLHQKSQFINSSSVQRPPDSWSLFKHLQTEATIYTMPLYLHYISLSNPPKACELPDSKNFLIVSSGQPHSALLIISTRYLFND